MTTFSYPCPDPVALAAKVKAAGGPTLDPTVMSDDLPPEHGVHLSYVIDAGTITIAVQSKPFYVPMGQIKDALDGFFA
jgi:hypothetical protein